MKTNLSLNKTIRLVFLVVLMSVFFAFEAAAQKSGMNDIDLDIMACDFPSAMKKCEQLLSADVSGEVGLKYASILHKSGEFEKASKYYLDLSSRFPTSIAVFTAAGDYELSRLNFDVAAARYKKAFDMVCAQPDIYSAQSVQFGKLFDGIYSYNNKFKLYSAEIELHVKAAKALHSVAPLYVSKAISYLLDTKEYKQAQSLAADIAAVSGNKALVANTLIAVYEKLVSERIDFEKNSAELIKIYEEHIENGGLSQDARFVAATAYYNFLQESALFTSRLSELRAKADAGTATDAEFRLLLNFLMERPGGGENKKYISKYLQGAADVKKNYYVARLLRRYSEYFASMTRLLSVYPFAKTDDEKAELYMELAENFSRLYFIDCRYLIFKSAAVDVLETNCGDFLAGAAATLNSRRFLRSKLDAIRVSLREMISRRSAEYYFRVIIERFPNYRDRDAVLMSLGGLYKTLNMPDESLASFKKVIEEKPSSAYRSDALNFIVRHYQTALSPPQAAEESIEAVEWFFGKCGAGSLSSARQAIESMISFEPPPLLKLTYNEKIYEYIGKLVARYPKVKWLRDKYVGTCASRVNLNFNQRISLIDGFLKSEPYDRELLSSKEKMIQSEAAAEKNGFVYEKMLLGFYDNFFFLSDDYMKKYLELLNKRHEMEANIETLVKFLATYPDKACKIKLLAESYFFLSRFEEAEPWFDKYVKLVPTDTSAMKKLFNLKRSLNKNDEATALVAKMIAAEPSNREHYISAGDLLALAGKWAEAESYFRKITAIDPQNNDNYLELATIFWDYFKYNEGLSVLSERRAKACNDFIFGKEIASLFELNDSIEVAIPEYITVVCSPDPEEEHDNSKYSTSDSDEGEGAEGLAEGGGRGRGHSNRRYSHYNYRYERPESEDVIESRARIVTLYKRERIRKIIDASFEKLISGNSGNFKLPYEYAKILLEYEQKEKAAVQIMKARDMAKKGYQLVTLANLAERSGMIVEARDMLKKTIELEPKNTSNYNDAIEYMAKYNFHEDRFALLRARMNNFPDDLYYVEDLAKLMMDAKTTVKDNFKEAESLFRKLTERNPRSVTYRNYVSDAIIKTAGIEAAIAYLDGVIADSKKIDLSPDNVTRLHETRANLFLKSKKTDAALEIFAKLIIENPYEKSFAKRLAQIAGEYGCYDKICGLLSGLDESRAKPLQKNLMIARFNAKCGKSDPAVEYYKKALAIAPRDMDILSETYAYCRFARKFTECSKLAKPLLAAAMAAKNNDVRLEKAMTVAAVLIESGDTVSARLLGREHVFAIFGEESYKENTRALDRYIELLDSYAMYADAGEIIEEKLKFLQSLTSKDKKYDIRATREKLAQNLYASRNYEKALSVVMDIIDSFQKDPQAGEIPDDYLKMAVRLWKALGKYDEFVSQYRVFALSKNADEASANSKFLLRIFNECSDNRAYIDLVAELTEKGEYLDFAVERSIEILRKLGEPRREELMKFLQARIRHNDGQESSKNQEQNLCDIVECGVLAEGMGCPALAESMFGIARKISGSSATLRKIADDLRDARSAKALDYYDKVLKKYSERLYYLCAADIALRLAEAGFGKKACSIADALLKKYPEDPKIILEAAKTYSTSGASMQAGGLLKDYALKCARVSELTEALAELEKVASKVEFSDFLDSLIKDKMDSGKSSSKDYAFLLNRKAAIAMSSGGATAEAEVAKIFDRIMAGGPSCDSLVSFADFLLKGICDNASVLPGSRAAHLTYSARLVEAMTGDNSKLNPTPEDLYRLFNVILKNIPRTPGAAPPSFKKDILPILSQIKKKVMFLDAMAVVTLKESAVSFENQTEELYSFFREFSEVSSRSAATASQGLLDAKEYPAALKLAALSLSLDDVNENARFLLARCQAASGATEEARVNAAAVDYSRISMEFDDAGYGEDDFDYCCRYDMNRLSPRNHYAEFVFGLGMKEKAIEVARETAIEIRKNNSHGRYYLMVPEYRKALEIEYSAMSDSVSPDSVEFLRSELSSMIEESSQKQRSDESPAAGSYALADNLRGLLKIYCALLEKSATAASSPVTASDYFLEASARFSMGAFEEAGRLLTRAHKSYPGDPSLNYLILDHAAEITELGLIKSASGRLSYSDVSQSGFARGIYMEQSARRNLTAEGGEPAEKPESGSENGN